MAKNKISSIKSNGQRLVLISWVVITALILVVVLNVGVEGITGSRGYASESLQQAERAPGHSTKFRSLSYGNTYWSVTETRVTNSRDRKCLTDDCASILVNEVVLTNNNNVSQLFNSVDMAIEFNGKKFVADRIDGYGRSFLIGANETKRLAIVFAPKVSSIPDLDNVSFTIKKSNKTTSPATVLLSGDVSTQDTYVGTLIENEQFAATSEDPLFEMFVTSANLSKNYKLHRTQENKLLANFDIKISRSEYKSNASYLKKNFWTLTDENKETVEPFKFITRPSRYSGSDTVSLQFLVSDIGSEFILTGSTEYEDGRDFIIQPFIFKDKLAEDSE